VIFGTDGIRDIGGEGLLSPQSVGLIGRAIAFHLEREGHPRGKIVLAMDTRSTGPEIEKVLTRALDQEGCSTIHGGVLPTPAVSLLLAEGIADLGLVISASHNPPEFNGIKILDSRGAKLSTEQEELISGDYDRFGKDLNGTHPVEAAEQASPEIVIDESLGDSYVDKLLESFPPGKFLDGLSVVLDCARGAACGWAPEAFRRAGADVTVIHGEPDGARINVGCGSLFPGVLGEQVKQAGASIGIAFDGDADRALFCDENGTHVDGDDVIVIWARAMMEEGSLDPALVALTVMSNVGVEEYLGRHGIAVVRTAVGDRAVAAALEESGGVLGGEPSGHIIHYDQSATGDGIRTGLAVARRVVQSGRLLSGLCEGIPRFPQQQRTLRIQDRPPMEELSILNLTMQEANEALGDEGRILVRYSGTEPLLRLLVEAKAAEEASRWIELLEDAARREDALGIISSTV